LTNKEEEFLMSVRKCMHFFFLSPSHPTPVQPITITPSQGLGGLEGCGGGAGGLSGFKGALAEAKGIVAREGARGLYRGLTPEICKIVPMVREFRVRRRDGDRERERSMVESFICIRR